MAAISVSRQQRTPSRRTAPEIHSTVEISAHGPLVQEGLGDVVANRERIGGTTASHCMQTLFAVAIERDGLESQFVSLHFGEHAHGSVTSGT